jgi:cytochrome c-type biogenesis protein CcmF
VNSLPDVQLPEAPRWSVFTGDLGAFFIALAVACFAGATLWAIFDRHESRRLKIATSAFSLGATSLIGAFACLAILFVNLRFEWKYVRNHSDSLTELGYRIAGVWSGQEGSFLLWGLCSAIFGVLTLRAVGPYRRWYVAVYSAFLAGISGILLYESPFVLTVMHGKAMSLPEGVGLAPSLLNYWVIIHPPTIFLGFGSLTIMFALACAAMIQRKPVEWIPIVRPWALVSLALLGVGLCMGGFWAYETLGWGGFWMWDPVENTSFVPWCLLAAFIHGVIVQTNRGRWVTANLLMAGLPFLSFIYGTFLTRSGLLGDTSVHSFAEMNDGALWLLIGVGVLSIAGFLYLWFSRKRRLKAEFENPEESATGFVREDGYRYGNLMLTLFALVTGVGMSWPLLVQIFGKSPELVEEKLYHQVVPYLFLPTMALMAIVPFIGWRKTQSGQYSLGFRIYATTCLTIALAGLTLLIVARTEWAGFIENKGTVDFFFGRLQVQRVPWTIFLASVCYFVLVANGWRLGETIRKSPMGIGPFLSHGGLAVLLAGLILSRGLEQKKDFLVQEGTSNAALGYIVTGKTHTTDDVRNRNNRVRFDVQKGDRVEEYRPGFYYMEDSDGDGEPNPMTWPYIHHEPLHDVYFTLHGMELNATAPTSIKPGQTVPLDRFDVTYQEMVREGEFGKAGTSFAPLLLVKDRESKAQYEVTPKLVLVEGGMQMEPAVFDDFFLTAQSMDAATQSFTLQLHFRRPLYAIELFVKPFTALVWIGTGILTFAILLTAVDRRPRRRKLNDPPTKSVEVDAESPDDALISTAQS